MRIEPGQVGERRRRRLRSLLTLPGFIGLLVALGLLLVTFVTGVIVGARLEENGNGSTIRFLTRSSYALNVVHPGLSTAKAMLLEGENVPFNFAKGLVAVGKEDRLVIDIEHVDLQRIAAKRAEALALGILFADGSDYVPATITWGDESERVRLRLKGDQPDHYDTEKWSLRVRVRGDDTLAGMERFSIQHPKTRNFFGEWLFMQAARREGIAAPRYRFVDVTINGTNKGIYALEEFFEKRLLENDGRREGPILKFNEDLAWRAVVAGYTKEEYGSLEASAIEGWAAETGHGSEFERAASLLDAFRRGEARTTEVFDGPRLATYFAMRDLFGAPGSSWQNYRFYCNPVTSKLEPVAFDGEVHAWSSPIQKLYCFDGGIMDKRDFYMEILRPGDPMKSFFRDLEFFALYVQALERVSAPDYLDELYADIRDEMERQVHILYKDYPYLTWSDGALRENQAFIRAALSPHAAIHAYHEGTTADVLAIRVANIQSLPIEVLGLRRAGSPPVEPLEPQVLRSKRYRRPVDHVTVHFPWTGDPETPEGLEGVLALVYRILGQEEERSVEVVPWSHLPESVLAADWIRSAPDPESFDFLTVVESHKRILFVPGTHVLDRDLVFPAGYTVHAGPGVRVDVREGAKIVSYSPLAFVGDEETPVVFESTDFEGQGLVVLNAERPSTLQHVVFEGLGAPEQGAWSLLGAVTFYESPVELDHVRFESNRAEDALNLVRTDFTLSNAIFTDAPSDAFDGDFVRGEVSACSFVRCGNDAVDFAGSVVELRDVRIDDVGDKALSIGERSEVEGAGIRISNADLGIACKDLSAATLDDVLVTNTRVAFSAFRKKPEYGQATIDATGVELDEVEREFLVEQGSVVTVNGRTNDVFAEGVAELLYGNGDQN